MMMMAKAGRKPIDFESDKDLLNELCGYLDSLKFLKENDKRCKSFFNVYTADKISAEQKKWLLTLRRDMNNQRKRDALFQEISDKENHSDLETLAIELSNNNDRDSFFNLQKVLDLQLSKKNEKQAFSTKKKALERKVYEQEKKYVSKEKMENHKKFFLGGFLQTLHKELEPELTEIAFLNKLLESYTLVHTSPLHMDYLAMDLFRKAAEDPRCPDEYVDELLPDS